MGAAEAVLVLLPLALIVLFASVKALRALARRGGSPWIGLALVVVAAGLGFLAYAIDTRLGGLPRNELFAFVLALAGALLFVVALVLLVARPAPAAAPAPPASSGRWILLMVLGGFVAGLVLVMLVATRPGRPEPVPAGPTQLPAEAVP